MSHFPSLVRLGFYHVQVLTKKPSARSRSQPTHHQPKLRECNQDWLCCPTETIGWLMDFFTGNHRFFQSSESWVFPATDTWRINIFKKKCGHQTHPSSTIFWLQIQTEILWNPQNKWHRPSAPCRVGHRYLPQVHRSGKVGSTAVLLAFGGAGIWTKTRASYPI